MPNLSMNIQQQKPPGNVFLYDDEETVGEYEEHEENFGQVEAEGEDGDISDLGLNNDSTSEGMLRRRRCLRPYFDDGRRRLRIQ